MAKANVTHELWKIVTPGYLLRNAGRGTRPKPQQGFRHWLQTGLVARLHHAGPQIKRIDW